MKVSRDELYELGKRARAIRHEDFEMLQGLAGTVQRVRAVWAKAEADADFRRTYGRAWTLEHCEERWAACRGEAVDKIRLVPRKR